MSDQQATVVYTLLQGSAPLLVSVPHAGTELPADQLPRYHDRARQVEDTDWFLDRLYRFAHEELGASLLLPRYSRYVVDLNRPSENTPMYAGRNNTELCPLRHFTGEAIYRDGQAPDSAEIARRVAVYWAPYHAALAGELQRLQGLHPDVVLFDAHSIRSELPWLFDGTLPHFNLGTVDGTSCAPDLRQALQAVLEAQPRYSHVIDGRFKGGHITRHYGQPNNPQVHAVQLEMCWRAYMDETPPRWNDDRAAEVTLVLRQLLQAMIHWARP
ncbi:MAG TPA: N-formylglutamate deformylase [Rubrivivax sp.]|nr:N-formylglutamate deformylase [Rubrivivax sp.]